MQITKHKIWIFDTLSKTVIDAEFDDIIGIMRQRINQCVDCFLVVRLFSIHIFGASVPIFGKSIPILVYDVPKNGIVPKIVSNYIVYLTGLHECKHFEANLYYGPNYILTFVVHKKHTKILNKPSLFIKQACKPAELVNSKNAEIIFDSQSRAYIVCAYTIFNDLCF